MQTLQIPEWDAGVKGSELQAEADRQRPRQTSNWPPKSRNFWLEMVLMGEV